MTENQLQDQDVGTGRGRTDLPDRLAMIARELRTQSRDVVHTLDAIVAIAVDLIDGCDEAAVSIVHRDRGVTTPAASGAAARSGDELQYELNEGPCLDAVWDHETVISDDLAHDPRWATWGPRVGRDLGIRSMLCLHLFTAEDTLGALNLYSYTVDAFDADARVEGLALAAHAAVALASAQEIDHLKVAVDRRTVIGQAEGILMERFKLSPVQSFAVLTRISSTTNRKLFSIADELVSTGELATLRRSGEGGPTDA